MNNLKAIYVSAHSAVASIVVTVFLTIFSEFSAPFKNWLTGFTGHHWITKSWISLIVFVLMYAIFSVACKTVNGAQTRKALVLLEVISILAFLTILGFFAYEFLV